MPRTNLTYSERETLFPFINTFDESVDGEYTTYGDAYVLTVVTSSGSSWMYPEDDTLRNTYKVIAQDVDKELYLSEDFQSLLMRSLTPLTGNVYDILLKDALYSTSFYVEEIGFTNESNFTAIPTI